MKDKNKKPSAALFASDEAVARSAAITDIDDELISEAAGSVRPRIPRALFIAAAACAVFAAVGTALILTRPKKAPVSAMTDTGSPSAAESSPQPYETLPSATDPVFPPEPSPTAAAPTDEPSPTHPPEETPLPTEPSSTKPPQPTQISDPDPTPTPKPTAKPTGTPKPTAVPQPTGIEPGPWIDEATFYSEEELRGAIASGSYPNVLGGVHGYYAPDQLPPTARLDSIYATPYQISFRYACAGGGSAWGEGMLIFEWRRSWTGDIESWIAGSHMSYEKHGELYFIILPEYAEDGSRSPREVMWTENGQLFTWYAPWDYTDEQLSALCAARYVNAD